jgi:hypothetical protein
VHMCFRPRMTMGLGLGLSAIVDFAVKTPCITFFIAVIHIISVSMYYGYSDACTAVLVAFFAMV